MAGSKKNLSTSWKILKSGHALCDRYKVMVKFKTSLHANLRIQSRNFQVEAFLKICYNWKNNAWKKFQRVWNFWRTATHVVIGIKFMVKFTKLYYSNLLTRSITLPRETFLKACSVTKKIHEVLKKSQIDFENF